MIAPRKLVKFERFQEMVHESTAVYTLTENIRISNISRLLGHNPKAHIIKLDEMKYKRAYLDHYLIFGDDPVEHDKWLNYKKWTCLRSIQWSCGSE